VVVDKRRVDRSRVRLAEVEIGDETGTVSLRARDEQIDVLEEVSKRSGAVVLRNCTLELYQGKHIRLAVTKWGKLCVYPDIVASTPPPPSKMNFDRNFSLIDLSVVASETVEQQQESGYGNRAGKSSESQDARSTTSKSPGQPHSKHQQQQSSTRRNTRDKRQSRGKINNSPAASPQYAVSQTDAGAMQPQAGQMRYHGLQPFPGYDQGMDMSQYPYAHNRQQDVMASSSAQRLLLQQYELQQRQLQMYHTQPDRHRPGMGQGHHAQAPGMMLQHVVPSGSFDTTGEYQVPTYGTAAEQRQHPSAMPVVGSSPMLVPMGATLAGISGHGGTPKDQHGISGASHRITIGVLSNHPQQGGFSQQTEREIPYMSVSPDDSSQFSAGKMNPEATAFAPSYMGHQGM
jgi:replication factor A1